MVAHSISLSATNWLVSVTRSFFLPVVARNLGFDQNFHCDDDLQTGVIIPSGRKSKEPVTRELVGGEILSDRESKHWMRVPSNVNNIKHKSDIWNAD